MAASRWRGYQPLTLSDVASICSSQAARNQSVRGLQSPFRQPWPLATTRGMGGGALLLRCLPQASQPATSFCRMTSHVMRWYHCRVRIQELLWEGDAGVEPATNALGCARLGAGGAGSQPHHRYVCRHRYSLSPHRRDEPAYFILNTLICCVFLGDVFYRGVLHRDRRRYWRWGWLDLVSSLPAITFLRSGRVIRVIRIVRVLRAFRSARAILSQLFSDPGQGSVKLLHSLPSRWWCSAASPS